MTGADLKQRGVSSLLLVVYLYLYFFVYVFVFVRGADLKQRGVSSLLLVVMKIDCSGPMSGISQVTQVLNIVTTLHNVV